MQPKSSLNKFIIASILMHLALLGGTVAFNKPAPKLVTVEISFGDGNSRGGSGPLKAAAPAPAPALKKVIAAAAQPLKSTHTVKTDAPVISKTENVNAQAEPVEASATTAVMGSQESGNGIGTTSGSGSGTTSGSGKGINDPRVRYHGQVYKLVNSHKQYPRRARALHQEGRVVAKIKLSKDGKLLNVEIVESSSFKSLAQATLDAIKGIPQFPKIPNELGLDEITFNIPFEYSTEEDFI